MYEITETSRRPDGRIRTVTDNIPSLSDGELCGELEAASVIRVKLPDNDEPAVLWRRPTAERSGELDSRAFTFFANDDAEATEFREAVRRLKIG
jgi:hypothetical protein